MNQTRYCLLVSDPSADAEGDYHTLEAALEPLVKQDSSVRLLKATGIQAAKAELKRLKPHLVLTPIQLEDNKDWLPDLCESIFPSPVVVYDPGTESAIDALRLGACDYFQFPITDPTGFVTSIKQLLYKSKLMSESAHLQEELEQSLALLREDQQAGRHVQQKMLPVSETNINDYCFEYQIKPSLFLSGDFIDYFRISESLTMFYLADISGHGASSAFVTVLLKNMTNRLLRNYNRGSSFHILSPTDVLSRINKELLDTGLGKHLTMFVGLLDRIEGTLQYGAGGHFPMPILYQDGKAEYLAGTGMPVGLFDDAQFEGKIVPLQDHFRITLFSDGILEIIDRPDLQSKEDFLLKAVEQDYSGIKELSALLGVDKVEEAPDDIAILTVSHC